MFGMIYSFQAMRPVESSCGTSPRANRHFDRFILGDGKPVTQYGPWMFLERASCSPSEPKVAECTYWT